MPLHARLPGVLGLASHVIAAVLIVAVVGRISAPLFNTLVAGVAVLGRRVLRVVFVLSFGGGAVQNFFPIFAILVRVCLVQEHFHQIVDAGAQSERAVRLDALPVAVAVLENALEERPVVLVAPLAVPVRLLELGLELKLVKAARVVAQWFEVLFGVEHLLCVYFGAVYVHARTFF
ncbi:hypothetical protein BpHYR1_025613 [Brachionus plicatilis]|uniref:Uncharacterized protein n=1 Tax=Brachionus plicatilis TaxID=10195 RepID=A0A3M7SU70_BRAPC|nr:hypothetical protein BpHYR1_025613 [Brachionus plicatilis]